MTTTTHRPSTQKTPGQLARFPGSVAYLLALFPVSMLALTVLVTGISLGGGLLVLLVGFPIVALTLGAARAFGTAERYMLTWTKLPPIASPRWADPPADASLFTKVVAPLSSWRYWAYLGHQMILSPIVATVTFSITVTWLGTAIGGMTYWMWGWIPSSFDNEHVVATWMRGHLPILGSWSDYAINVAAYLAAGLICLITIVPLVTGLTRLHHGLASVVLGKWSSDDFAEQAAAEKAARKHAVLAEDSAMRRLERDLHDGPQQRLVRLKLDLAQAERRIAANELDDAQDALASAQEQTQQALDELRALSRGFAPPLLTDRGLTAALVSIADQAPIDVNLDLPQHLDQALAPEAQRGLYFVVAELLTNAVKHSTATTVDLVVEVLGNGHRGVWVTVTDYGIGGAEFVGGHGLAGLRDRVQGLRGELTLESPIGGPTRVVVMLPVAGGDR